MAARFFVRLVYKFNQKFGKIEAVIGIALSVLTPQGLSVIFWIACGAYIKDLMHDDKVRAMKLFIAKKKAEQAAKDTCHS